MNEDIYTVYNKKLTDKRMKRKSISYFVTYFVQVKNIVLTLPIIMSSSFNLFTYFVNVGNNLSQNLPTSARNPTNYIKHTYSNSSVFRGILIHKVQDIIMGLDPNKSSIGVPLRCVKLSCPFIREALAKIFNHSLDQGIVPDILKISKITPVDKGDDPTNYRPIATLSVLSQAFEKLIFKQLNCYIEKQNILFQYQFGFRKGHSTAQAIAELTDT